MPAADYCRDARRLRRRFASDPRQLLRKLRDLSDHHDAAQPAVQVAPTRTQTFAAAVLDCLEGRDLRYSNRLYLLDLADKLGIRRFDANLIIATLQHRAPRKPKTRPQQPASREIVISPTFAAFMVVQSTILLAVAWFVLA